MKDKQDSSPSPVPKHSSTASVPNFATLPVYFPTIPVVGKNRFPAGFCYPIGVLAMSKALAGLPAFDRFALSYSNRTPIFSAAWPLKEFPVLRVTCAGHLGDDPVSEDSDWNPQRRERWILEILPIPFRERDIVQALILERAVPPLREWLSGPEAQGPKIRRSGKVCWYAIERDLVNWTDDEAA